MLNVTARDTTTNQIQQTRLSLAGGLSREARDDIMAQELPAAVY